MFLLVYNRLFNNQQSIAFRRHKIAKTSHRSHANRICEIVITYVHVCYKGSYNEFTDH